MKNPKFVLRHKGNGTMKKATFLMKFQFLAYFIDREFSNIAFLPEFKLVARLISTALCSLSLFPVPNFWLLKDVVMVAVHLVHQS